MHHKPTADSTYHAPKLLPQAIELATYMRTLSVREIQKTMGLSEKLALTTQQLFQNWNTKPTQQTIAIDSFAGDIYSGLQTHTWSTADRKYADEQLRILSGLYGVIKPLDGIYPYRLEMGYKLPDPLYANLYTFWEDQIARTVSNSVPIINLAAAEYSKAVLKHISNQLVIAPRFLTIHPQTQKPTFVVVHAKIARGAFAGWVIKNRIMDPNELVTFSELGYEYDKNLSSEQEPVFICKQFAGLGLSVRLRN